MRRAKRWAGVRLLLGLGVATLLVLLAPTGAQAKGEKTWYAQKVTVGDTPLVVEHFWSKGRRFRAETVVAGHPIVTIVRGDLYYVLDTLEGTGIAIRRSAAARAADSRGERPFGNEGARLLAGGAEKVRTERVSGRMCDVYRLTDAKGRREVWLSQDALKLPIRVETFVRSSGATARTDYLDWSRGIAIADSFFGPDPSIVLETIEYEEYLRRAPEGPVGPAPVLYGDLLHGHRPAP